MYLYEDEPNDVNVSPGFIGALSGSYADQVSCNTVLHILRYLKLHVYLSGVLVWCLIRFHQGNLLTKCACFGEACLG